MGLIAFCAMVNTQMYEYYSNFFVDTDYEKLESLPYFRSNKNFQLIF